MLHFRLVIHKIALTWPALVCHNCAHWRGLLVKPAHSSRVALFHSERWASSLSRHWSFVMLLAPLIILSWWNLILELNVYKSWWSLNRYWHHGIHLASARAVNFVLLRWLNLHIIVCRIEQRIILLCHLKGPLLWSCSLLRSQVSSNWLVGSWRPCISPGLSDIAGGMQIELNRLLDRMWLKRLGTFHHQFLLLTSWAVRTLIIWLRILDEVSSFKEFPRWNNKWLEDCSSKVLKSTLVRC